MPKNRYAPQRWISLLLGIFLLAGCAGYQTRVAGTVDSAQAGRLDLALADLEKNNAGQDKDLLYFLEKGELLRMQGDLTASTAAFAEADAMVRAWEDAVRNDPAKLAGEVGAFILNDTTRRYDGRDYEKVMLSVRLALNYVAEGNWDAARVEIKKMHEREALIAEFRSKELDKARDDAEAKGVAVTSPKEIAGYPVDTLNAPEVLALKNAYESAVANYLAGFVYEALGEPSLAAAGYRKAIEMSGGSSPLIEEALHNLDASRARPLSAGVDTLFIIESGGAPAIVSRTLPIPLPIPGKNGTRIVMTPLAWPVVQASAPLALPDQIRLDDSRIELAPLTFVDHMARRAIADEMPGIIARSAVRAIVKGAAQAALQDNAGGAGAIIGLVAGIAAIATEQADERVWRLLPNAFSVGRAILPFGTHRLSIDSPLGAFEHEIRLSGKYALVSVRQAGSGVYLAQTPFDPLLEPPAAKATAEPAATAPTAPAKPEKAAKAPKARSKSVKSQAAATASAAAGTNPATKAASPPQPGRKPQ